MYLLLALGGVVLAILAGAGVVKLPPRDFVEYWAAGDVLIRGGNPYDVNALNASLHQALGDDPFHLTMMWNPPWTLPLTVPFALLPIRLAHVLWVAGQLTLVLISVRKLSRVYPGLERVDALMRIAALLFPPTLFLMMFGQIGGVCLFGVAGFLYWHERERPIPAGMCLALTAIKPHLLFAFGLFLILEAIVSRRTRIAVLAGIATLAVAGAIAALINPQVYSDYMTALAAPPGTAGYVTVREWRLPVFGFWLRMWVDPQRFWIQFVPMAVVAASVPLIWWRTRKRFTWPRITPVLVLLSLLAAPYGGWLFDLVLLLVPLCHAASAIETRLGSRAFNRTLAGFIAINLVILLIMRKDLGMWLIAGVWFIPLVAAGYIVALWLAGRSRNGVKTSAAGPP